MKYNKFMPAVLSVFLLTQIGCALSKETIHIDYIPRPDAAPVAGAENLTVGVSVKDRRADQSAEIARKINGFGAEMAPISNDESIPMLVERAITKELTLRGYHIGKEFKGLTVELLGFSHKYNAGFFAGDSKATVSLLVAVKDGGGKELFEKTFSDTFSHSVQVASGHNVKQAYEQALPGAIRKLMDDPEFHTALAKAVAPQS